MLLKVSPINALAQKILLCCVESKTKSSVVLFKFILDTTGCLQSSFVYKKMHNQALLFLTFHNGFINTPVNSILTYSPVSLACRLLPFFRSLNLILSICCLLYQFSHLFSSSNFRVHKHQARSEGVWVFLNPNRQIDLDCLLNPFVFGLALMKELLGREHIRLCILYVCVCK